MARLVTEITPPTPCILAAPLSYPLFSLFSYFLEAMAKINAMMKALIVSRPTMDQRAARRDRREKERVMMLFASRWAQAAKCLTSALHYLVSSKSLEVLARAAARNRASMDEYGIVLSRLRELRNLLLRILTAESGRDDRRTYRTIAIIYF